MEKKTEASNPYLISNKGWKSKEEKREGQRQRSMSGYLPLPFGGGGGGGGGDTKKMNRLH